MKEHFKKWFWSAAGVTFACTAMLFAARYIIAQEVATKVAPIQAEQRATSKIVADMQFEERYSEVQNERDMCLENHSEMYCDAKAAWRWEVYYDYIDCIAPLEYNERINICGPPPEFVPPIED